jgi:glycosyltransferase involved in cell wall biosynthesis
MPCLDEAETVAYCVSEALDALASVEATGEVLVVDNGSSDGSPALAEAAGARVVHEDRLGYGRACRTGFGLAGGKFVTMGDSDGTYNFGQLPEIVRGLRSGFDLVVGTRLKGAMEQGSMPFLHRYVGNPLLTRLLTAMFSVKVTDILCGIRGFRADLLPELALQSDGMELCPEMIIRAAKLGLSIDEIPVDYRKRQGLSKLRTFRDGWVNLRLLGVHAWGPDHLPASPAQQSSIREHVS